MDGMAICAGGAGLELGVDLALGGDYRTVCYVEREAFAAAVLVARMEDQTLGPAPIWDDLRTFEGAAWSGCVDLICAGFPCQPFSGAGQQLGADDPRHLWPEVARIVREVGPEWVFLENVPQVASGSHGVLAEVVGDLAQMGFDAEWCCVGARDVGASHRRDRWWLLAHRHGDQPQRGGTDRQVVGTTRGEQGEGDQWERAGDAVGGGRADVADTHPVGRHGGAGDVTPSRGWNEPPYTCDPFPPGPDDPRWFTVWADGPQPSVRRDADGMAHRLDRLRVIGNGVVPLVAAYTFTRLARSLGWDPTR